MRARIREFAVLNSYFVLLQIEGGTRPQSKYLSEYFAFMLEFAKTGEEEVIFLIHINAISLMVNYFLAAHRPNDSYVSACAICKYSLNSIETHYKKQPFIDAGKKETLAF